MLPIAKEAGYDFTAEELKSAEKELAVEKGISEEELENVCGGTVTKCFLLGLSDGDDMAVCVWKGIGAAGIESGFGITICSGLGLGIGVAED